MPTGIHIHRTSSQLRLNGIFTNKQTNIPIHIGTYTHIHSDRWCFFHTANSFVNSSTNKSVQVRCILTRNNTEEMYSSEYGTSRSVYYVRVCKSGGLTQAIDSSRFYFSWFFSISNLKTIMCHAQVLDVVLPHAKCCRCCILIKMAIKKIDGKKSTH